jgi:23S rRNA pseudouridine2604 synthase
MSICRLRIGRVALGKGTNGAMPPGTWRYFRVAEKF